MRGPIAWIRRKIETRRRQKEQEREERLQFTLGQLRELFIAIDEWLTKNEKLDRHIKRRFWDDFRKHNTLRKDVFDALVENEDIEVAMRRIVCQKQKSKK